MFEEVLEFWFKEIQPEQQWRVDPGLDDAIRQRFGELHRAASLGELWSWRSQARGRLAEIIVLDQFSRNMHRGTREAFASDAMALALAQEAVAGGHDAVIPAEQCVFLYTHTATTCWVAPRRPRSWPSWSSRARVSSGRWFRAGQVSYFDKLS